MYEKPKDISPALYDTMKQSIRKDVLKRVSTGADRYLQYVETDIRDLAKFISETQDQYSSTYSNIGYVDKIQKRVDVIVQKIQKKIRQQRWFTIKIDTKEILKSIKLVIEQK